MQDEEGNLTEKGSIKIAKRADKYPLGLSFQEDTHPIIIISDEMMENFEHNVVAMHINAEDPYKLQEEIVEIDKTNQDKGSKKYESNCIDICIWIHSCD